MNYKLTIQYDGTNYAGWQIQHNAVTVQQKITDAINLIIKENVNLIGSGRTDTGVHAFGQSANFRTKQKLDLYRFIYSLNSILPNDIAVKNIIEVDESFHARFDAKRRSYLYLISKMKSPFYLKYSHLITYELDCHQLNLLSKEFVGEHDFTSFSRKNTEIDNKFCSIYKIHWRASKEFIFFFIEANRFLHGMVRTIIGSLLFAEKNNLDNFYLQEILNKKDRETANEAVPAKGLFLFKVKY